jgi:nucleoside-diphosphate-sugar epimerase
MILIDVINSKVKDEPVMVIEIYANNNLAKDSLNWEPKFNLEDMIRTSL